MPRTNKLKGKRLKKTRTSERIKFDLEEAFSRCIIAREAEGRSPRTIERDRIFGVLR